MNEIAVRENALAVRQRLAKDEQFLQVFDKVERAIFLASTKPTFGQIGTMDFARELKAVLPFTMRDVGYRMRDDDLQYLCTRLPGFLQRNFYLLTFSDWKLAFELLAVGALDEYLPKRDGVADRGHYQSFDLSYIGKVLEAYTSARRQVMIKAKQNAPKQEEKRDYSENERAVKERLCSAFNQYKETGKMPEITDISVMLFYELLSSIGYLPSLEERAEEQGYYIEQLTASMLRTKSNLPQWFIDRKKIRKDGIKSAFDKIIKEGKDLCTMIQ